MICAVYKSLRRPETYLFVPKREAFADVPEALLNMFGSRQLVMMLPLEKRDHLGFADIDKVKSELTDKGYYLQLPPPVENLLETHKQSIGFESK